MKTQARLLSILLIFSLMLQTAFAEEQVVSSFKSYETENKFSIKPDAVVETHSTGKICDLIILGDGLTKLEDANSSSPVYIVNNGESVQFSFINIKDFINSQFWNIF